jgi:hypothetical protein
MNPQGKGKIEDDDPFNHLSLREKLWLRVYPKAFFLDRPRFLWSFLEWAFRNHPQREFPR